MSRGSSIRVGMLSRASLIPTKFSNGTGPRTRLTIVTNGLAMSQTHCNAGWRFKDYCAAIAFAPWSMANVFAMFRQKIILVDVSSNYRYVKVKNQRTDKATDGQNLLQLHLLRFEDASKQVWSTNRRVLSTFFLNLIHR